MKEQCFVPCGLNEKEIILKILAYGSNILLLLSKKKYAESLTVYGKKAFYKGLSTRPRISTCW